ncbi:MAG: permease [Hyphomicrobiales bacterium]|nr:permease [Hyphomicrobiales bacterium]
MKHQTPVSTGHKFVDTGFIIILAIAFISATLVWIQKGQNVFWTILVENIQFGLALLPKIICGVFLACVIPLMLPREKVQRWIGPESGFRGLWAAALAGIAIPGGPSVTLPLAGGLMIAGADLAAGITMVTAWALLSVNRTLIWEMSFLPPHLVLLRVGMTFAVPVMLGWMVRRLQLGQERAP